MLSASDATITSSSLSTNDLAHNLEASPLTQPRAMCAQPSTTSARLKIMPPIFRATTRFYVEPGSDGYTTPHPKIQLAKAYIHALRTEIQRLLELKAGVHALRLEVRHLQATLRQLAGGPVSHPQPSRTKAAAQDGQPLVLKEADESQVPLPHLAAI